MTLADMSTVWMHRDSVPASLVLCAVVIGMGVAGIIAAIWPPRR